MVPMREWCRDFSTRSHRFESDFFDKGAVTTNIETFMPSTTPPALDKRLLSSHSPPSLPTSPIAKRPRAHPMPGNDSTAPSSSSNPAVPPITIEPPLCVKLLGDTAKAPTRGSAFAAGYDLYAAESCPIPAKGKALVGTSLAIVVPGGCCRYPCAPLDRTGPRVFHPHCLGRT